LETFFVLEGEGRITDFTKTLQKQVEVFRSFFIFQKQVEVFRSFFIFLSKEEKYEFGGKSNTEDRDFDFETNPNGKNRLIAAQSFLYVSTAPHHWMIDAFDWCQLQSQPVNSEEFIKELERIDDSLNNSADGNWKRNSPIKDLKEMTYPSVSHYWFYRLDYELWKRFFTAHSNGKNPDDIWSNLPKEKAIRGLIENFRFRRCGSVEHIVPQTTMNGLVRVEPDHTFGNLALISSSRNSTFSNNMPETKKAMILQSQQPYTESLKMLHFLWCDPASASHGDKMFEILNHAKK
jgi:hypothetical protein